MGVGNRTRSRRAICCHSRRRWAVIHAQPSFQDAEPGVGSHRAPGLPPAMKQPEYSALFGLAGLCAEVVDTSLLRTRWRPNVDRMEE